jgi:PTH1 family peptidyl-tRNA hydrolase
MKLLVGLGNPEKKHLKNRHNVGFMFLDTFNTFETFNTNKHTYSLVAKDLVHNILLAKPNTFMNASGKAVKALIEYYKISLENVYVVHDDLDIAFGEYKIQKGKGPKIHNGIISIEESIGTTDFWRIRIGVDHRTPENRIPGEAYVLSDFEPYEMDTLKNVFEKVKEELL